MILVKHEALCLLGKIAEKSARTPLDLIRRSLLKRLTEEIEKRIDKISFPIVSGCLHGFTGLWMNYDPPADSDDRRVVFKAIIDLLDPGLEFRQAGEVVRGIYVSFSSENYFS